jgi:hypothetical protein
MKDCTRVKGKNAEEPMKNIVAKTVAFDLATALALLTGVLTACGPVPGGSLGGTLSTPPSDWSDVLGGDRAFCEIESRPSEPHSIQLECFVHDGRLYVQSHRWAFAPWWPTQSWASIWLEEPEVLVRIDSSLFELRAVHVTLASERSPILEFRGYDPVPDGIAVFRFDEREQGALESPDNEGLYKKMKRLNVD